MVIQDRRKKYLFRPHNPWISSSDQVVFRIVFHSHTELKTTGRGQLYKKVHGVGFHVLFELPTSEFFQLRSDKKLFTLLLNNCLIASTNHWIPFIKVFIGSLFHLTLFYMGHFQKILNFSRGDGPGIATIGFDNQLVRLLA